MQRPRFGWQIKAARVACGLTLDDVAAVASLNRNSVHRVEKAGPRDMGSFACGRIAKALNERGVIFSEFDGRSAVSMPNRREW